MDAENLEKAARQQAAARALPPVSALERSHGGGPRDVSPFGGSRPSGHRGAIQGWRHPPVPSGRSGGRSRRSAPPAGRDTLARPGNGQDRSQGVQLAKLQALLGYWETAYDWRKAEAKLNALPQFLTDIDRLDIHFIHVRSPHANALPLIMTHGWPGSIFELLKVVGPLTDPTAHGGTADDAFHLVLPSLPGFGFSEKPKGTGWNPERVARAWDVLMKRLGYTRYVSQGGDWGAIISDAMGRQAPSGLLCIHVNRVERSTTIPPEIAKALRSGDPAPANLTAEERAVFDEARAFLKTGFGYAAIMGTRPQTVGYGLADSPAGLAAWFYDKLADWVFTRGEPERVLSRARSWTTSRFIADEHGDLERADLLGEQCSRQQAGRDRNPGGSDGFPRRGLQAAEELGGAGVPQSHLLQPRGQRRTFRRLGRADLFSAELRAAFRSLR